MGTFEVLSSLRLEKWLDCCSRWKSIHLRRDFPIKFSGASACASGTRQSHGDKTLSRQTCHVQRQDKKFGCGVVEMNMCAMD